MLSTETALQSSQQLTTLEQHVVTEYCIDFDVSATSKRIGRTAEYVRKTIAKNHVQAEVYRVISDRFKSNQKLVESMLSNAQLLAESDIAEFVDWGEEEYTNAITGEIEVRNYVRMKDKSQIKNTKAIKSIKMGKHGLEVTLHDKIGAQQLMFQALGLFKKAKDAQEDAISYDKVAIGDNGEKAPTTLREALLQAWEKKAVSAPVTVFDSTGNPERKEIEAVVTDTVSPISTVQE